MKKNSASENPFVVRTDFSDDNVWRSICEQITTPDPELGFIPYVHFLNDSELSALNVEELLRHLENYEHTFIFIVDSTSISNNEHPILCINLYENSGEMFRVIPSEMWGIENNLSMANMDFEEFSNAADSDGVFRGFK